MEKVGFRHLWGQNKREKLLETAEKEPDALYNNIEPLLSLGLPLVQTTVERGLVRLASTARFVSSVVFLVFKTKRDSFLIDIDIDTAGRYASPITSMRTMGHEDIARCYPGAMKSSSGFVVRNAQCGARYATSHAASRADTGFVRHTPIDHSIIAGSIGKSGHWSAWYVQCADYRPHVYEGNMWLDAQETSIFEKERRNAQYLDLVTASADNFGIWIEHTALWYPAWLHDDGLRD